MIEKYGFESLRLMMAFIVREYPEKTIREYIIDVFVQVINHLRDYANMWFTEILTIEVPSNILNEGEKTSFIENLKLREYSKNMQYYSEFFEKLCKRCKTHNLKNY